MQSIEQQSQINKFYKEFDNINKLSIEESYMGYIEQFIADDFEAIASYFSPPVSFNGNIAETKEDVINHYKNMKANIQDGYAYSVVDKIKVYSPKGDDSYLLCSEFTRYNSNDEIIFEGAANYIYEQPISSFKMKSTDGILRLSRYSITAINNISSMRGNITYYDFKVTMIIKFINLI